MAVQGNKAIETFERVEYYFSTALKIDDEDKRFAWVEHVLRDDQETLKEVCLLLIAHHESDNFLSAPPVLKQAIDEITTRCPDLTGRRLGVYEVIRKIARGGMGSIYSAKRVDGEYQQMVAIKVVELSHLEMELFQKERQFLADIQHPNIVTLLDGGTLEEGFPYLVMELVDGISIDQYIRSFRLTTRETVKLCCELCGVVDDAHQQGVIHCDLKPDNILVINKGSRKGTLKLLDFGIAQSLTISHNSSDTASRAMGITPEYASPQRHRHRSPHYTDDVYSLGVIFGQLLSRQPLSLIQKTSFVKRGYQSTDINALAKSIDNRELVQILRKATADRRNNRYQSAKDFQHDLQNWLDEKPVNAAQGGLVYLYGKYIYRYRYILFMIISFVLLALLLGQITGGYFKQQHYSNVAQQEAIEAVDDLNKLLETVPITPTMTKEVTKLIVNHLETWSQSAPDNHTIKMLYAELFARLANVTGHPYYLNLGNLSEARNYYQNALQLYTKLEKLEKSEDNQKIISSAKFNKNYLQHRLLELEIYEQHSDNLEAMSEIQKKMAVLRESLLADQALTELSSKQRILVLEMWLAGAYESLRLKKYTETWKLLQQSKQMLFSDALDIENTSKELHYLIAFYHEIMGHQYYLQGNVNAALSSYTKIKRPTIDDELMSARYQALLIRVDSAFACLGYLQKNNAMRLQHFKYFEYARTSLEKLAIKDRGVPFLQQQRLKMNRLMDIRTVEGRKAFCLDPIKFLLPPLAEQ